MRICKNQRASRHLRHRRPLPRRLPQPARSGWRWPREGAAAGRSRRDAKRPSRDRGSRHADRVGRASPIPRACRRGSRIPFRSHGSSSQPRAAPSPGSPPPVPIQSPKGSTRPICLRTSPTMKVQVRRHINEEPQVLNHAGRVRDVLRHLIDGALTGPDLHVRSPRQGSPGGGCVVCAERGAARDRRGDAACRRPDYSS
jgi:hypothetical protein